MDNNIMQTEAPKMPEYQPTAEPKAIKINLKIPKKKIIIIAAVIVVLLAVYFCRGLVLAATVGGSPISRSAVIRELEKTYGSEVLNSMVTEKLVHQAARAKKIVISQETINAEIKATEDQVNAEGTTLAAALVDRGMTMKDLKDTIILHKEMEQLVIDKLNVTDQEIAQYIKDNKVSVPKGQEATIYAEVKKTLRDNKLNQAANALLNVLRSQIKIKYFVKY